jgi:hypothetical protein
MAKNRYAKQRVASVASDLPEPNVANSAAKRNYLGTALKNTIETQPYTAVIVAFGLGWLWGRMHRPF